MRYGLRTLLRTPGFTIVAVITLALGIGANTAIFSVVKAVLLEPLAYKDADRIVAVQTLWTKTNRPGNVSGGDYVDLVAEPRPFAAASRYTGGELPVETGGQAEFVAAYGIDTGFAHVFQLKPVAGRLITPEEFKAKATVAVVGEGFAVRHFGEANRALGQVLRVEQSAMSIVGVLPAAVPLPAEGRTVVPDAMGEHESHVGQLSRRGAAEAGRHGGGGARPPCRRRRPPAAGVSLDAQGQILHRDAAQGSLCRTQPHDALAADGLGRPGAAGLRARTSRTCCCRATARSREMALRAALGARRRRLVGQMLARKRAAGLRPAA